MQAHFEETVGVARLEAMTGQLGEVEELCSRLASSVGEINNR
jgi:hypothetical protein